MITVIYKYCRLLITPIFLSALFCVGFAVLSSQQHTAYAISHNVSSKVDSITTNPATSITGTWQVNANGSRGTMNITMINNVSFQGTITFDDVGGRVDPISGSWNDATGVIIFTRLLPNGATQVYTGFLGDNHPEHMVLAGSFTQSDITANVSRNHFGWVATRGGGL